MLNLSSTLPRMALSPMPQEVYFYGTCLTDMLQAQAGLAAVELLESAGIRVIYPQKQTCCGQPAFNSGFRQEAAQVIRPQLALFPKPIPVVVPSGSCGAMLRVHLPHVFEENDPDHAAAKALSERVFEWSEFMAEGVKSTLVDAGPPIKVAYHPSCHLVREMGVKTAPQALLSQLENVKQVPFAFADECCGFGGTFAVKHSGISGSMMGDKVGHLMESGAEVLVSMDSGCLMNLEGGLRRRGSKMRVLPLPLFLKERILGRPTPA